MTRDADTPSEEEPRDPAIEAAIRTLVDQVQVPPEFTARVRARVAQRHRHTAPFRIWIPVLVTGLLLSLALNVWWGALLWRDRPPSHEANGQPPESQAFVASRDTAHTGETIETLFLRLAETNLQTRRFTKARDAATAALVLNPENAQASRYRAMAHAELGDQKQAIKDWRHAALLGDVEARAALIAYERQLKF